MPSGLALGAGLAKGFDSASRNFLSSMTAVQQMKMQREKFDLDKKMSDLQMKKLSFDLDPEVHAQQKMLMDKKIKAMDSLMSLQEAKASEIMNRRKTEFTDMQKQLQTIKSLELQFPEFTGRLSADQKGMRLNAQGPTKSIPEDIYSKMTVQAKELAKSKTKNKGFFGPAPTPDEVNLELDGLMKQFRGSPGAAASGGNGDNNTGDGLPDYDSLEENELFDLAQKGDEEAARIGFSKFGSE